MITIKEIQGTCHGRDSDGQVLAPADPEGTRGPRLSEEPNLPVAKTEGSRVGGWRVGKQGASLGRDSLAS